MFRRGPSCSNALAFPWLGSAQPITGRDDGAVARRRPAPRCRGHEPRQNDRLRGNGLRLGQGRPIQRSGACRRATTAGAGREDSTFSILAGSAARATGSSADATRLILNNLLATLEGRPDEMVTLAIAGPHACKLLPNSATGQEGLLTGERAIAILSRVQRRTRQHDGRARTAPAHAAQRYRDHGSGVHTGRKARLRSRGARNSTASRQGRHRQNRATGCRPRSMKTMENEGTRPTERRTGQPR